MIINTSSFKLEVLEGVKLIHQSLRHMKTGKYHICFDNDSYRYKLPKQNVEKSKITSQPV